MDRKQEVLRLIDLQRQAYILKLKVAQDEHLLELDILRTELWEIEKNAAAKPHNGSD